MASLSSRLLGRLLAVGVMGAGLWLAGQRWWRPELVRLRTSAAWLLAREEYAAADSLVDQIIQLSPQDPWGRLLAGELAAHAMDDAQAISYFEGLLDDPHPLIAQRARFGLAERLYHEGELAEAEAAFSLVVKSNPADLPANRRLAHILYLQGRTWEALPYLEEQVRQGNFIADELVMLACTERWVTEDAGYRDLHADEYLLQLGKARIELLQNLNQQALPRLREVVERHPQLGEAQAALGKALLATGEQEEFARWRGEVTRQHLEHPEVWMTLATAAQESGDRGEAIRCLCELLERHPFHGVATYQLSQELSRAGEVELAKVIFERSARVTQVNTLAGELRTIVDFKMMRDISRLLLELGRPLEAAGWADMAKRYGPQEAWTDEVTRAAVRSRLVTQRQIPELDRIREVASLLTSTQPTKRTPDSPATQAPTGIQFAEVAAQVGLNFQYDIGKDVDAGMEHIFETTGGGVAVIDYDQDGLVDMYFAQSRNWKLPADARTLPDHLYRNLGTGAFQEVAGRAGINELEFSQGVTAGDINEDGLPDLYVCNLDENSCFLNNGDGTFTEVAQDWGLSSNLWSLSAAMADLNGDHLTDLYVVNYLDKTEVAARDCKHDGEPRSCAPTMFPGSQDRLFLSDGQGGFRDVTEECGIVQADGKGLGLLIADFFNGGQPEIYVGNDTAANFFFIRQENRPDGVPQFLNEATLRGLAYNEKGQVQATMGMATADLTGDHLLDIFATNFYQDANTLYVQTPDHYFVEETRSSKLYDAGFYMLGFGTQFIDATRSGLLDIVITNGHVDRTFATGEPDRMRPQYFHNQGNGQFAEVQDPSLGSYFTEMMLGRGLAVLDWNNDGRQDVVVTHLDRPAALLENRSPTTNNFLRLTLVGRRSCREPIGARVDVILSNGKQIPRQLMTGDGYEVRNDSRLFVGLGASTATQVLVQWPGGERETFALSGTDQNVILVEGQGSYSCP